MDMQQTEVVDNAAEVCDDDTFLEDMLNGQDAGRVFAQRHIIDKINMFMDVYRREGYSEAFIGGYLDGINEMTGGNISLRHEEVDEETEALLDNPPDSD